MVKRIGLLLGAACFVGLAAVNGPRFDLTTGGQFALWIAGAGLLTWGLGGLEPLTRGRFPAQGVLLIGVLLLAAGLRLWNLENAVHFYVDEGNFVEGILRLENDPNVRLIGPFNYVAAFTWIYPYFQTASAEVFGHNLLALRVVSAAFGVLGVAAIYRLGRALFDARIGLLAALLLATFPPHVHFSRLGLNNIADPLFGTLALAALVQALRGGRLRDFALAGLWLGLTQYFYEGGRLLYPALALAWGLSAALGWKTQRRWRGLAITALVTLLTASPVYYTLLAWDISLTTRLNQRGLDAGYWRRILLAPGGGALMAHLRDHVLPPFLHYVSLPDEGAFYYGGHTALILPPLVPVFGAGLVSGLRRSGVAGGLLLFWLILTALGNSLIEDSVWTSGYVAAFPALALLLAAGLNAIIRAWERYVEKANQRQEAKGQRAQRSASLVFSLRLRVLAFIVLLVFVAGGQVIYYVGPHLTAYQTQIRPHHDQQDMVFRVRDLPPGTQVYLITDDPDLWMPLLVFLSRFWGMPDFAPQLRASAYVPGWDALDHLDTNRAQAFFYAQEDTRTQAYLQARFGPVEPLYSPYNVPREKQFALLLYAPQP